MLPYSTIRRIQNLAGFSVLTNKNLFSTNWPPQALLKPLNGAFQSQLHIITSKHCNSSSSTFSFLHLHLLCIHTQLYLNASLNSVKNKTYQTVALAYVLNEEFQNFLGLVWRKGLDGWKNEKIGACSNDWQFNLTPYCGCATKN